MKFSRLWPLFALPAFTLGTVCASAAPLVAPGLVTGVPHDTGTRDLGRAAPTFRLNVAVALGYRHQAELEALVTAQGDSSSPYYHKFLTKSQFNNYFSPTADAYARASASLVKAGFTITHAYANRKIIDASAPVATAERYFGTEIHRVAQTGYGIRYQNVREAHVPADVQGIVTNVIGLNNIGRFHTYNHFGPRHGAARGKTPLLAVPGQIFGPDLGYGPAAYIDGYDIPAKRATGKGQVSAVVIDADFLDSDLAAYLNYFGVYRSGPPTVRVPIDGGPPPGLGSPDSVETTLDVETIASLAPGTSLYVYEFPDFTNTQYIIDAYEQVVIDGFAGTVNSSFGGCEFTDGGLGQASNEIALQGAALGITFHASTGDSGSGQFGCASTSVSSPASAPYFTAVGGTSLYLDPTSGAFQREFAWSGGGGGVSSLFGLPSYQRGVAGVLPYGRNLPDVSFDADPSTGTSFYYGGGFVGPIGGTSLSSPIFGAVQTLENQLAGTQAGFVNPSLYKTFKKYGYKANGQPVFRDITSGSNGFYSAKPGYDQTTGIGAEIVGNLSKYVR